MRLATVDLTIESIAAGEARPRRLILWLSQDDARRPLPKPLIRLQKRGLEIESCPDYRSHKKYFPYVCSQPLHVLPLVTADDDVLYPRTWLLALWRAYESAPDSVHAHRAKWMVVRDDGTFAPYREWPFANGDLTTPNTFPTGVGGVLYPPRLLGVLRDAGEAFAALAPTADDAWLHAHTLKAGMIARQIGARPSLVIGLPGTQQEALWHLNVDAGGNDQQIEGVYGPMQTELLMTLSTIRASGIKPWISELTPQHADL